MIDVKCCPICNSKNVKIIKELEFKYPKTIENYYRDTRIRIAFDRIAKCDRRETLKYNIFRCNDCGFIYLNPRLTNKEVLIKYNSIAEGTTKAEIEKKRKVFSWSEELKEQRTREFVYKHADSQAKILLDFGGADGGNCIHLRKRYSCEVIEVTGFNMVENVKYLGENLTYCKGRQYDIILLLFVLEHMNKPLEFIPILKQYLKRRTGIMVVGVPAGYSAEWKHISEPLTHCNYFSKDSLRTVMELAGLKTLEIKQYPFPKHKGDKQRGGIYYAGKRK